MRCSLRLLLLPARHPPPQPHALPSPPPATPLCRGIDLKSGGRYLGHKNRTQPKSDNVYVQLLSKVRGVGVRQVAARLGRMVQWLVGCE